ncbi:MAG TPA: GntG family PLP-dependent aldolase [Sphingobacteriaceae bacterium]|nr:GntG family PLP-dependent aldolase [Sphingobacteriaceae bacterium]
MIVDLRSDTVTKPGPGMIEAMFSAKVGDDVFEEDETVNLLEEKLAGMFGMEAGLFCPSGTMTNQIAIKCFTQPMDEVITDETAHVYRYEGGGIAFNSGASVRLLYGDRGKLTAEMIEGNINPDNIHYPRTSLIVLENSINKGGGSYYTLSEIEPIYHLARLKKLNLHVDGARIFNALTESGDKAAEYGRMFDGISVCLSKGLGAPVGSVLLGSLQTIAKAKRIRKVLGGGMRQAGYLAAAGIYALDNNLERLKTDHIHAKAIETELKECSYIKSILPVETNIIIFKLNERHNAGFFVEKLADKGIKCNAYGNDGIRFVTHLDVTAAMIDHAIDTLKKIN